MTRSWTMGLQGVLEQWGLRRVIVLPLAWIVDAPDSLASQIQAARGERDRAWRQYQKADQEFLKLAAAAVRQLEKK